MTEKMDAVYVVDSHRSVVLDTRQIKESDPEAG